MEMDLNSRIKEIYGSMSKGQKLIAEYILNNYDKAAFMTASRLGKTVGVSESTVVRFAGALGYDGYPRLQKALQEMIRNKLTMVQRIELSNDMRNEDVLRKVLKADINNIRHTINEMMNEQVFDTVVEKFFSARNIYILGLRSAAPLAEFFGYYLRFIFDNVRVVTSGVNDIVEQLSHIQQGDLLFAISFPRYARRTVDAIAFSRSQGADTVALTDSQLSPLSSYAEHVILAKSNMASFVDSLVAPLSVINALIVSVGLRKKADVSSEFHRLEKIWDEYHVYVGKDRV
jgi:DNA-binding MurR/RpiR family transcriptional regulator